MHIKADNTPCPCILWSLSGRNPQEFHDAQKAKKAKNTKPVNKEQNNGKTN